MWRFALDGRCRRRTLLPSLAEGLSTLKLFWALDVAAGVDFSQKREATDRLPRRGQLVVGRSVLASNASCTTHVVNHKGIAKERHSLLCRKNIRTRIVSQLWNDNAVLFFQSFQVVIWQYQVEIDKGWMIREKGKMGIGVTAPRRIRSEQPSTG